ncbi:ankyrin [Cryphonectria parasitica EP155]|uniref:Ankyrin n=1 Tax=Cryphonectria parasitica (strain ATCC 38755 / EP155) TaxID=660469 RepID=A0A9P4Y175_CRYP1|nr:ankyrin [Cryphonectria parasitica EP155]KAF3764686.1 ankyrin [Cryphonectria parasitica EP155]
MSQYENSPKNGEKHGLFRLHPKRYRPDSCSVDIVAIHGLGGSAFDTWTDHKSEHHHLWLRDSLPSYIPEARVMTYGYDSSYVFSNSLMGINDFAKDLLTRLCIERRDALETSRPLFFVCHSLGGIVFKQAIVLSSLEAKDYPGILDSISGVISSQELEEISRDAKELLKKINIVSFYEQKPLTGFSLIVDPPSAILGLPNERSIPINADHRDIAKVSPRHTQRYKPVWATIQQLIEAIVKNVLEQRSLQGLKISLAADLLWKAMREVLAMDTMKYTFIIIDAIEELGDSTANNILEMLNYTLRYINTVTPAHRVRILVSSRPKPRSFPWLVELRIVKSDTRPGIKRFLQGSLEQFAADRPEFATVTSSKKRIEIVNELCERADGSFLIAAMVWGDFRNSPEWDEDTITRKLRKFGSAPHKVSDFYDIIYQIDSSVRDQVRDILAILAAAARPLSTVEIGIILGFSQTDTPIRNADDIPIDRSVSDLIEKHIPELIARLDDDTVTFVHLSFKEYLLESWAKEKASHMTRAGRMITRACLKYLKLQDMLHDAFDGASREDLTSRYPFLSYAGDFHKRHILSLPYTDYLWLVYADAGGPGSLYTLPEFSKRWAFWETPLQVVISEVAMPHRETLLREFVQHGYDINETWLRSDRQGGALHSCCRILYQDAPQFRGNGDVKRTVLLLLALGADPNLPREAPRSNIASVILEGNWDVYHALLRNKLFDPNAPDERGRATIHHLVSHAPSDMIPELVEGGTIEINAQDKSGSTALHLAVTYQMLDTVRTLLRIPGTRLDLTDVQGRTPLALAAYWDHKQVAYALIERSDAMPVPDRENLGPLVLAAKHGDMELCRKLLETSQYQNIKFQVDHSGKGVLHHLAANNWTDLLERCLRRGDANVNHIDHHGESALHIAATLGNTASCEVLVRHGASMKLQDRLGRTAPQAAADAGFKDTLMTLLRSRRADPNQKDFEGRNLVHWAATIDCVEIVEFLAGLPGVDIARKDNHGKMPIDIAFICKCPTVGKFLSDEMRKRTSTSLYFDIYDWKTMYNSPIVEYSQDEEREFVFAGTLEEREFRRQAASEEAWFALQKVYPPELWALVKLADKEVEEKREPFRIEVLANMHQSAAELTK